MLGWDSRRKNAPFFLSFPFLPLSSSWLSKRGWENNIGVAGSWERWFGCEVVPRSTSPQLLICFFGEGKEKDGDGVLMGRSAVCMDLDLDTGRIWIYGHLFVWGFPSMHLGGVPLMH